MTKLSLLSAAALLLAGPAFAADPATGEDLFKKCKACHSIVAPDGTEIQKGGRTGPNLYGIMGRAVASDPDYTYGPSILAVGAAGKTWDASALSAYLADPAGWLKTETGDSAARSKMSFKLGSGGEDLAAYLASVVQ
ncbi:c-type cytochrome [Neotabrizicola sp. VNH66]|uniref:c-type cytochrome n=1 Tax=Neotabrizicola sp. VNH66 TaxID=3400918 RepID=UPI003C0025D6